MAQVLPQSRLLRIEFFESRLVQWAHNAALIGLTPEQVPALALLVEQARNDYDAMQIAKNAAKDATQTHYDSESLMAENGASLIKTIKAFAQTTSDPAVYTAASIPPPAKPSPQGTPGAPENVRGTILNTGAIELNWNAPAGGFGTGVYFTIERRTVSPEGMTGSWTSAGAVAGGDKQWTDETVPTGVAAVSYRLTAWRAGHHSDATDPVEILFGTVSPQVNENEGNLSLAA